MDIYCENKVCNDYRTLGNSNVVVLRRYGNNQRFLYMCKTCGKTFSGRRNTIFFNSKLSDDKIREILFILAQGESIRNTAKKAGVNPNTVLKVKKTAVDYVEQTLSDLSGEIWGADGSVEMLFRFIKQG